jgi:nucleotide-binding universal stress UspA family protein
MSEEIRRVLVGFDGSSRAVDALHLARTIAYAEDAELMVASVYESESIFDAGDRYLPPVDEEEARAKRDSEMRSVFAQVDIELGNRHYERRELWGSPAGELTALAEAAAVDIIVVGSTHRGKIGRVLPGSVGRRLLQGSPCAVAVAPSGYAEERRSAVRIIGVGYTGTAESRQALGWAHSLARRVGARLRLIAVIPEFNPAHFPGWSARPTTGRSCEMTSRRRWPPPPDGSTTPRWSGESSTVTRPGPWPSRGPNWISWSLARGATGH